MHDLAALMFYNLWFEIFVSWFSSQKFWFHHHLILIYSWPDLGSSLWGMLLILASTNLLTARIAAGCFLAALIIVLFVAENVSSRKNTFSLLSQLAGGLKFHSWSILDCNFSIHESLTWFINLPFRKKKGQFYDIWNEIKIIN